MSIPRPKSPAILLICAMGLVGAGGCAASSPEGLRRAVRDFNRSLRWQRFARASRYLETSRQDSFLQRYSAAEDLLHIQSMAVQRVRTRRDDAAVNAQVTVVARYYLLPSTVVEEARIRQQWRWQESRGWVLTAISEHLAPELDAEGTKTAQ